MQGLWSVDVTPTLVSTQRGGRPMIVCSGGISSSLQHSNRGMLLMIKIQLIQMIWDQLVPLSTPHSPGTTYFMVTTPQTLKFTDIYFHDTSQLSCPCYAAHIKHIFLMHSCTR